MRISRSHAIAIYGALLLLLLSAVVWHKERALGNGVRILLPLAPVDPRALLGGDYMRLDYALSRELATLPARPSELVITLDKGGVACWQRQSNPLTLKQGEYLLTLQAPPHPPIAPDAYFFEEGQGAALEQARFGEFRLNAAGELTLLGLTDDKGQPLGTRRPRW